MMPPEEKGKMMINNKKLEKVFVIIIYSVLFYAAWAVFELLLSDNMLSFTDNGVVREVMRSGVVKNLIWTVPALLLVRKYDSDMMIGLKEMFSSKVNVVSFLPVFIIIAAYVLFASFRANEGIYISDSFGAADIITVLFVGITEESVFRGWLLNSTLKNCDSKPKVCAAVLINAVMFLIIHFPIWIHNGVFEANLGSTAFLTIIILSCLFSWCFIKSKNIFVPIVVHMFYDLLIFMFI